jgi:hypothetical protein
MNSTITKKIKNSVWSEEEESLILKYTNISILVNHPLMIKNNRTYKAIFNKQTQLRNRVKTNALKLQQLGECSQRCLKKDVCDLSCENKIMKS